MSSVDLSRLTAIVRTCERPRAIARLVASLRRRYPQLRLLVADDSRQPQPLEGADWIRLPADVGVSAGRNAALARVRTPYFLLLEDAVELTRRTRIEPLLDLASHSLCDIAAGQYVACRRKLLAFTVRRPDPGYATFEFTDGGLDVRSGHRAGAEGFLACDLTHNFFVARTDKVRAMGGWDPQLLVDEQLEFFVRAQRFGLRVGVCPEVIASRWPDQRDASQAATSRDFTGLALAKIGVARLVDADGQVREATSRAA
ncbi:MAG TPA: glycosyltransferase [Lacipirellulaceae bacterium]|nr:glycosyltransferase [Lacipirellulaceae bacterium]